MSGLLLMRSISQEPPDRRGDDVTGSYPDGMPRNVLRDPELKPGWLVVLGSMV